MEKKTTKPTPPGTILREEFLRPLQITRRKLAEHLGWNIKQVDRLCYNETRITPTKAVQLAGAFGVSPAFWMKAQMATDMWEARLNTPPVRRLRKKHKPRRGIGNSRPQTLERYGFADWPIGETRLISVTRAAVHDAARQYNRRNPEKPFHLQTWSTKEGLSVKRLNAPFQSQQAKIIEQLRGLRQRGQDCVIQIDKGDKFKTVVSRIWGAVRQYRKESGKPFNIRTQTIEPDQIKVWRIE